MTVVTNKNANSFLWLLVCFFFFLLLPSISNPTWEIDIFHLQWRCIYIKYIWYIFFPGLIDWFFLLPRCCLTIFTEARLLQLLGSFLWYMLSHVANHKSYNIGRISFYIESKTMRDRAACTHEANSKKRNWDNRICFSITAIFCTISFSFSLYVNDDPPHYWCMTLFPRLLFLFFPVISTINASIGHANKTCHK